MDKRQELNLNNKLKIFINFIASYFKKDPIGCSFHHKKFCKNRIIFRNEMETMLAYLILNRREKRGSAGQSASAT